MSQFIECECKSFDHISCLHFFKDKENDIHEFYLEFKVDKFPIFDKKSKGNFWMYLKNVYRAIVGKPNKYSIASYWDFKQVKQIKHFIQYCTHTYNLKERN